jgi:hypothetical protein
LTWRQSRLGSWTASGNEDLVYVGADLTPEPVVDRRFCRVQGESLHVSHSHPGFFINNHDVGDVFMYRIKFTNKADDNQAEPIPISEVLDNLIQTFPLSARLSAVGRRAEEILRDTPKNSYLSGADFAFIVHIVRHHPEAAEKIGDGIRRIFVREAPYRKTLTFWIERVDGSEVEVSYMKCLHGLKAGGGHDRD